MRNILTNLAQRLIVFVTVLMPSAFFSRVQSTLSEAGSRRLDIWSIGILMLRRYGVTGVGLANFQVTYDSYAGICNSFPRSSQGRPQYVSGDGGRTWGRGCHPDVLCSSLLHSHS
jgi:hypothetical protein